MYNAQFFKFVVLAALWGASFLFMRVGAPEFGALPLAFGRVGIAAVVMLPIVIMLGMFDALKKNLLRVMCIGVINSAIPFALYCYAALSVTAGFSSIVNASTAIWTAVVAAMIYQDKLSRKQWLGVVIGFVGVMILFWDKASALPGKSFNEFLLAGLAGFAATWCYAFAANWSKRLLAGVPSMVSATGSQIGATLVLAPLALWLWPTQMPSAKAWGSLVALAVVCTAVAYALYFALITAWGASRTSAVTFLIPVFGIFWGWALLAEPVSPLMLLSMLIIIAGTVLVIRK